MNGLQKMLMLNLLLIPNLSTMVTAKWVEGHLKTTENWSFLARFCFLSMEGQFEYLIEFDPEMGFPNLLLYYDDESQWPNVYHSNKSCRDRENVLNKLGQNQIIPLSHWYPENDFSGCLLKSTLHDDNYSTASPQPTKSQATKKPENETFSKGNLDSNKSKGASEDPTYYDKFLKTTVDYNFFSTVDSNSTNWEAAESTSVGYSSSPGNDYEWETMEGEQNATNNGTNIKSDLKDVEYLFRASSQDGEDSQIRKRALTNTYERIQNRKFNKVAPRDHATYRSKEGAKSTLVVSCHNVRRFRSVRERWWFIAVSSCGQAKGINIKYKFLMTNGPSGDYWHEHFSADEFYVLPVLLAFCIAYVFVIVAIVMCSVELKTRQLLHTTYKLFVVSVVFQEMGIILQCLAYMKYAINGVGLPSTKVIGQLHCGISEMTYLLLLILMAKGYTITRARLKVSFTVKLTIFMCCYAVTYLFLFIYQAQAFDPGEVLYLYESPVGYGLIVLRVLAWFMYIYAVLFTMKKYPEKSIFYCPFSVCGSLWFYSGPLFILTANTYVDKWVRESVVTAVLLFITFSGHISFLLLTLPVFANKNFPYHVRTTQIGVMEVIGNVGGNSTVDNFGHSVYEPNRNGYPQTVIIPLTRRTEELIGSMYGQYLASAPALSLEYMENNTDISKGDIANGVPANNAPTVAHASASTSNVACTVTSNKDKSITSSPSIADTKKKPPNERQIFSVDKEMDRIRLDNGEILHADDSFLVNSSKLDSKNLSDSNQPEEANDPFVISANVRSRRHILEPLERSILAPPAWTLAKGPATQMTGRKKKLSLKHIDEGSKGKTTEARNGIIMNGTTQKLEKNGATEENGFVPVDLFAVGSNKL